MKRKQGSLSAKTVRSTVQSCILFGLVVMVVALSFYTVDLTRKYIRTADTTVKQVSMSVKHGTDTAPYARQVMEVYRSLTDEQRQLVGTPEYREMFSGIDTTTKGGSYDVLINMLEGSMSFHTQDDISDIYVAMYDKDTSALVYIVDPDVPENRLMPGDWEAVDRTEMLRFLASEDDDDVLYDIGWTENYGLICTVATPLRVDGEIVAFTIADISLKNIVTGMARFAVQLFIALVLITVIIALFQTRRIKKRLVEPINMIAEASEKFISDRDGSEKRESFFSGLDIHTGDEIEHLAKTMAHMETALYEYGENLLKVTKEKERIGTELSLARKIQSDMLPSIFPPFPERRDFDIYASMTPAKEVGGDFYDFFLIDRDHLGLVMADVSGKGVPAALFMMMSKILINNFAMMGASPAKVLEQTNDAVCQHNEEEMFVTVWYGVLELSTGKITAANAGHDFPIIRKEDGDFELFRDKHGFVIGGMEGTRYSEYEMTLEKGGTLFLYTDGAPEATSADDELFGTDRLLEVLNAHKGSDPKELLSEVKAAIDKYVGDAEPFDDLTMLGIKLM